MEKIEQILTTLNESILVRMLTDSLADCKVTIKRLTFLIWGLIFILAFTGISSVYIINKQSSEHTKAVTGLADEYNARLLEFLSSYDFMSEETITQDAKDIHSSVYGEGKVNVNTVGITP